MFIIVCWLVVLFFLNQHDTGNLGIGYCAIFCPLRSTISSHDLLHFALHFNGACQPLHDKQISYFSSFILCVFGLTLLFWNWCGALIGLCLHTDQSIDIDANLTQVMDDRSSEYAMDQDIMLGTSFVIRLIICGK